MNAYLCSVLGLIAFHLSAALFGWFMFNWVVSTFVSSCVIGSLYLLVRYASRVYARFRLPPDEVITGRFTGNETVLAGQQVDGRGDSQGEVRDLSNLISREQLNLARAQGGAE